MMPIIRQQNQNIKYHILHNKGNFSYEIGYQTYIAGDSLASTSPSTRCGEGDLCGSSTRIPLSLFVPIIDLMA